MQNNPFDQFDGPTGDTVITKRANPFDLPKDAATLANTQVNTATNRAQLPFVADTASAQRDKAIADAARAEYERRDQPGDSKGLIVLTSCGPIMRLCQASGAHRRPTGVRGWLQVWC
ncbi:hypothetical protein AB5I41_01430 [Sphingomonas sp. MMS24-JH45]